MFITVNKIQVPDAHRQAVIDGFEKAMPGMQKFSGFRGMEIWTAEDNTLLAVSRWDSKEAMEEYTSNDLFKQHHGHGGEQKSDPSLVTHYTAKILG